jgi:hypothetical protein
MVDRSSIRVHQHAANVKKRMGEPPRGFRSSPACVGCSRGGLTTKIHAEVDVNDNDVTLKLSKGQAHGERKMRQ